MPKLSAGLLVYRPVEGGIEVLAVHPGGPFWAKKDKGAWSIPKGELEPAAPPSDEQDPAGLLEDRYAAARREFKEETGRPAPEGEPFDLGEVRQAGGKIVHAFALLFGDGEETSEESSDDGATAILSINSNLVEIEWPRGTGRLLTFPEVDKAEWMSPETAREKLVPSQVVLVDRLLELLGS